MQNVKHTIVMKKEGNCGEKLTKLVKIRNFKCAHEEKTRILWDNKEQNSSKELQKASLRKWHLN